ncbi:hypothetical protein G6F31_019443 [Rhizopus arrhizus]|nr:hypothetical protein G6F31_019443 [Rhizopus arrhizus]
MRRLPARTLRRPAGLQARVAGQPLQVRAGGAGQFADSGCGRIAPVAAPEPQAVHGGRAGHGQLAPLFRVDARARDRAGAGSGRLPGSGPADLGADRRDPAARHRYAGHAAAAAPRGQDPHPGHVRRHP